MSSEPAIATARKTDAAAVRSSFWLAVWTMTLRELIRFFRQRTRVIGALGQPVILWVLIGAGFAGSFDAPGFVPADREMTYQAYFFPGIAVLIILFTAIFSTISVIEDRREGFLQGVLVAPISRFALVWGKLTGGMLLAVFQALIFLGVGPVLEVLGLAPKIELNWTIADGLAVLAFLILLGYALTALGFLIAWPMNSTQGFHAIMSVFLLPMWLLSGAAFPAEGSRWLAIVIRLNPLTYGVAGLRRLMSPGWEFGSGLPPIWLCVLVTTVFCAACVLISITLVKRPKAFNSI